MSVLKSIIPGSDLGTMGQLGKFTDLPDVRQSLFAAYLPGTALGVLRTALDGAQYVRDKSGAGRHAKLIRPANEAEVAFTGYIVGTTLTVTAVAAGVVSRGMKLAATGILANTTIISLGTGTGGTGTYTVSPTQTLFSSGSPGAFTAPMVSATSLWVDPAHYLELPFSAQDVSGTNGEMTVAAVAFQANFGNNLPVVSDFGAADAYIIANLTASGRSQSFTDDGPNAATTAQTGGASSYKPVVMASVHKRTRSDSYWRQTGIGTGSYWETATKADGVVGGPAKLRVGTSYDTSGSFAQPGQIFAVLIYNKALAQPEIDATVYPALAALATAQGWGTL